MTMPRAAVVTLIACAACVVGLASSEVRARRLPAPGGKITMALPPELVAATTEAHLYVPIVEPVARGDAAMLLARPPLAGFTAWRSSVLASIEVDDASRRWVLRTDTQPTLVAEAVARCLAPRNGASWPAAVLASRAVTVDVDVNGAEVLVRFNAAMGALPELLAGCPLRSSGASNTGAYALVGPGLLARKEGGLAPAPLFGVVEIVGQSARADLVAFGTEAPGASTVLAPFPDVVVLLQSDAARSADLLGLQDRAHGLRGFLSLLRPDLLAAAYAEGRGAPVEGLLPPGIAPARPLRSGNAPGKLLPLALVDLGADAPRTVIRRPEGDALVDGVVERLALLLRNRGTLVDLHKPTSAPDAGGLEVVRWRPPTTDPALALLSLAGTRPELRATARARTALADPRLLSRSREERVAAALALERAWIEESVAVPLMTADRWFVVDPDLRGVVVRPDGVPLVDGAYFGGAYFGGAWESGATR